MVERLFTCNIIKTNFGNSDYEREQHAATTVGLDGVVYHNTTTPSEWRD